MEILFLITAIVGRTLATNVFFRKSFQLNRDWPLLTALAGLGWANNRLVMVTGLLMLGMARTGWTRVIRTVDRQDLINFSLTSLFYTFLHFRLEFCSPASLWNAICLLSLMQFIRNPADMLKRLRPLRVPCGPISFGLTMVAAAKQLSPPTGHFLNLSLAAISAVTTFTAIIILRPDNHEVINLVSRFLPGAVLKVSELEGENPEILISGRKVRLRKVHARLNIVSVAAAMVNWVLAGFLA